MTRNSSPFPFPPLHIAVLAFPFGTHAAPLLALAGRLARALPATARFSFLSTPKSIAALSFSANIKPFAVSDGVPEREVVGNPHVAAGFFVRAAPENFRKGIKEAEEDAGVRVGCLLTDAFLWSSQHRSHSLHCRNSLAPPVITGNETKNADQTLDFIPGLSAVHTDDLPDGILHGDLESPIACLLHAMGQKLPTATAVVLNSFEELEPATTADLKSKLRKVLHVAPPPPAQSSPSNDESGCLSWLDCRSTASVAYVSFGTITTPPRHEVLGLAEALEEGKVPFIWSIRDLSRHLLPEGFEERTASFGKVVSWAPQWRILDHNSVGVFVTHCGWNSVLESITGGVPMICRPFFGDQMLNSRLVQDTWRIGVRIEGGVFTKTSTRDVLELVLNHGKGQKMRENTKALKLSALKAVAPSGTSTQNFNALLDIIKAYN
ncbi:Anthocyanidin 3-O-glucosyltransferase [Bertholletia excelsa]